MDDCWDRSELLSPPPVVRDMASHLIYFYVLLQIVMNVTIIINHLELRAI